MDALPVRGPARHLMPADSHPERHLRIVAIGGGTGLSTLLHGLKEHVRPLFAPPESAGDIADLSAVVTVADEGGSSGRLRREFGMLPPGDIRKCLVALSEDEALLSRLFEYRFSKGRGLKGHSFGNLFLTALTRITGNFQHALHVSSEVLASCGRIFPSTMTNVRLQAELKNGRVVTGEARIGRCRSRIARVRLLPEDCRPVPEALEALASADIITLGPGSLFTSLIPNLLVKELPERIAASRAIKVYVGNLMMQPGETIGFTASEHIRALYEHAGLAFLDYAILNQGRISPRLARRYLARGARPVENDLEAIRTLSIRPVLDDLVAEDGVVRHNASRLATLIIGVARESSGRTQD